MSAIAMSLLKKCDFYTEITILEYSLSGEKVRKVFAFMYLVEIKPIPPSANDLDKLH